MGSCHSSLSCSQLTHTFNNCFGVVPEPPTSKKAESSNGDGCLEEGRESSVVIKSMKRSRKLSSKETCCTRSCAEDHDNVPYDLCTTAQEDQGAPHDVSSTNSLQSNSDQPLTGCSCTAHRQKCPCSKYVIEEQEQREKLCSDLNSPSSTSQAKNAYEQDSEVSLTRNKNDNATVTDNESNNCVELHSCNESKPSINEISEAGTKVSQLPQNEVNSSLESNVISNESPSLRQTPDEEILYFQNLVSVESETLESLIKTWNSFLEQDNCDCPSEVLDEIRSVIGKTHLVIDERFKQFLSLITQAKDNSDAERPVLVSDLQGFWDMILFQVDDVKKKFQALKKMQLSNWKAEEIKETRPPQVKRLAVKSTQQNGNKGASKANEKKRREAARKRLAEARKMMSQRNVSDQSKSEEISESIAQSSVSPSPTEKDSLFTPQTCLSYGSSHEARAIDALCSLSASTPGNSEPSTLSVVSSTSLVH